MGLIIPENDELLAGIFCRGWIVNPCKAGALAERSLGIRAVASQEPASWRDMRDTSVGTRELMPPRARELYHTAPVRGQQSGWGSDVAECAKKHPGQPLRGFQIQVSFCSLEDALTIALREETRSCIGDSQTSHGLEHGTPPAGSTLMQ